MLILSGRCWLYTISNITRSILFVYNYVVVKSINNIFSFSTLYNIKYWFISANDKKYNKRANGTRIGQSHFTFSYLITKKPKPACDIYKIITYQVYHNCTHHYRLSKILFILTATFSTIQHWQEKFSTNGTLPTYFTFFD